MVPPSDDRFFRKRGELPLPHLSPDESLARSKERLRRLEALAMRPDLSSDQRRKIENLARAQAAAVVKRQHLAGQNVSWPAWFPGVRRWLGGANRGPRMS